MGRLCSSKISSETQSDTIQKRSWSHIHGENNINNWMVCKKIRYVQVPFIRFLFLFKVSLLPSHTWKGSYSHFQSRDCKLNSINHFLHRFEYSEWVSLWLCIRLLLCTFVIPNYECVMLVAHTLFTVEKALKCSHSCSGVVCCMHERTTCVLGTLK